MNSENLSDKALEKLKNKKKDIIQPEKALIQTLLNNAETKEATDKVKNNNLSNNLNNNNEISNNKTSQEEVKNSNIETNDNNTNSNNLNIMSNIPDNSKTIKLFDKIITTIQEYLALTTKVDAKLFQILTSYISMDQLKVILEERDCLNICGNLQCDNGIESSLSKKFKFNLQTKEFSRDDVKDFFCSEKCFEAFKALMIQIASYDYLLVTAFEPIYVLSRIEDFYPQNKYLKNLSLAAKNFINFKYKDKETKELRDKYNKFFIPELDDFFS